MQVLDLQSVSGEARFLGQEGARPQTRALCAVAKNEALYIEEWVAFHVLQGVEAFIVFDNSSTDETPRILQRIAARIGPRASVEVVDWPSDAHYAMQQLAYDEGARLRALIGLWRRDDGEA